MLTIIEIKDREDGGHGLQSQSHRTECWLEGWLAVPPELEQTAWDCAGYCDLDIQDGKLVGLTPREQPPKPEPEPDLTPQFRTAMLSYAATSTAIPDSYALDMSDLFPTWAAVLADGEELPEGRVLNDGGQVDVSEETAAEAEAETQQQLNCYADVCEQDLAIPVVKGRKTDKEKFAGAEATYTIEAMMKDGKALQSGTSHYFGDKFSKAYDVTFTGRDNQLHHPYQTSWGVSTRLVGAIIMTHGDDDGLILPPAIAPIQVVVVPIAAHKPGVSEKAAELAEKISKYARVKLDDSDNAPGWKFSQWEMKGVPLRLEIGPKDLEKNQCVLVRRDTREKIFVSLDELETAIPAQLEALRKDLYERALANREKRTWAATTMEEVKELAKANTGYIKTMWCGDLACEMKMKEEAGLSSRCMPFEQEHISDVCPCCGKPASKMVYWGVAY